MQRHSSGETLYTVDIHTLLSHSAAHISDDSCCQASAKYCYYPPVFPLLFYPFTVITLVDRTETHFDSELVSLEKEIFHKIARHFTVGLYQYSECERMVYVSLTDVEYCRIISCQNLRQRGSHARTVITRDIYEYQLNTALFLYVHGS